MDLTEILWWSAGIFLLGILAGAVGMYRVQRKERSRELKKISDTVQRMTSGKELPDFSDCEETMDSKIRHQLLRLQEILVSQKPRCTERTERTSGTDFGNRTSDADTIDKSEKIILTFYQKKSKRKGQNRNCLI